MAERPSLRVLLSAFACDPQFGSDEEVGWQWARELSSRGYEVTVLTRASHRQSIESTVQASGACADVHFEYLDLPLLHALFALIARRNQIYYYVWQAAALFRVARLLRTRSIDLIHHVTWVSFRQPSFLGLLDKPFVFGPVAGGDEIPRGYMRNFSWSQKTLEHARVLLNRLVRFDPLMCLTYASARMVFFTSQAHLRFVPGFAVRKAHVELAIGVDPQATDAAEPAAWQPGPAPRLLFVGRLIGWKGLDIGLPAFAELLRLQPDATLSVIGDGSERERWQRQAQELGIGHAVHWLGWLPKAEVLRQYGRYDALFYPSLRDSGGFVIMEALQQGLPVVCFRLAGPGQVASPACSEVVDPPASAGQAAVDFAQATLRLLARRRAEPAMAAACRARALEFTWDALLARIYDRAAPLVERGDRPTLEMVCFTGNSGLTDYSVSLSRALQRLCRVRLNTAESLPQTFRQQGFEVRTVFRRSRHYVVDFPRFALRILRERPACVLFQGPLKFPLVEGLAITLWRARGIRVAMSVHDVLPHYPKPWSRALNAWFYRRFDRLVVHSEAARDQLRAMDVSRPLLVVPHGTYDMFRLTDPDRATARRKLGIADAAWVVLFFGHLEPRKGLLELIEVAKRQPGMTFLVAGSNDLSAHGGDGARRMEELRALPNAVVHDRRIPFEDVEFYFAAADVAALPYLEGTTSGVLKLALAFGLPVAATTIGDLPSELPAGAGELFSPGPGTDARLEQALLKMQRAGTASAAAAMRAAADQRAWPGIAGQYAAFLGMPAQPPSPDSKQEPTCPAS